MNSFILLVVMALVGFTIAEKYTDRFDNLNIKELLQNKVYTTQMAKCINNKGKCTSEGKQIKEHLPEALATHCENCTKRQEEILKEVIKYLINHEPELWEELKAQHDPSNKYSTLYEEELREILA